MALIYGTKKNDSLFGSDANDSIYGYEGNDILNGKGGINFLYGGAGNDTYVIDVRSFSGSAIGIDTTIVDSSGTDTISFTTGNIDPLIAFDFIRRSGKDGANLEFGIMKQDAWMWIKENAYAFTTVLNQYAYQNTFKTFIEKFIYTNPIWNNGLPDTWNAALDKTSTLTNLIGTTSSDLIVGFGGSNTLSGLAGNDLLRASRFDTVDELFTAKVITSVGQQNLITWLQEKGALSQNFTNEELTALVLGPWGPNITISQYHLELT